MFCCRIGGADQRRDVENGATVRIVFHASSGTAPPTPTPAAPRRLGCRRLVATDVR